MAKLSEAQRLALAEAGQALQRADTSEDARLVLEVAGEVLAAPRGPLEEASSRLDSAQERLRKILRPRA